MATPDRSKAPAYQWYPKDWDTDELVKLMSYEEEGVYRRLLDHQWLHGSIPADVERLARLLPKMPAEAFHRAWIAIQEKFTDVGSGRLANQRLERQRLELCRHQEERVTNGKRGAEARWGKPAGTPACDAGDRGDDCPGEAESEPESVSGGSSVRHASANVQCTVGPSTGAGQAIDLPMANDSSSSASASAKREIARTNESGRMDRIRAGPLRSDRARSLIERYPAIYARCRSGARYRVKEARDYAAFLELVDTEPNDERLDKMIELFLRVAPAKDFLNVPGTPRQLAHMLPEVDRMLREHGR